MSSTSWRKLGSRRLRGCGNSTLISATIRPGLDENTRMRADISTASSILWVTMRIDEIGLRPSDDNSCRSVCYGKPESIQATEDFRYYTPHADSSSTGWAGL